MKCGYYHLGSLPLQKKTPSILGVYYHTVEIKEKTEESTGIHEHAKRKRQNENKLKKFKAFNILQPLSA